MSYRATRNLQIIAVHSSFRFAYFDLQKAIFLQAGFVRLYPFLRYCGSGPTGTPMGPLRVRRSIMILVCGTHRRTCRQIIQKPRIFEDLWTI